MACGGSTAISASESMVGDGLVAGLASSADTLHLPRPPISLVIDSQPQASLAHRCGGDIWAKVFLVCGKVDASHCQFANDFVAVIRV